MFSLVTLADQGLIQMYLQPYMVNMGILVKDNWQNLKPTWINLKETRYDREVE